jgi:CDP-diacylglycerol--serine O-phosphatidyltransferase
MTWRQIIPTIITLMAMLSGAYSILLTLDQHYLMAALLIMLAMVLDGLDGNVARWIKGTSEFGAELDTYVDMTAFGLAPAILIYKVAHFHNADWRLPMTAMIILSGVCRLARFKVNDPLRGQAGYCGLPITASAGWTAVFVFLSESQGGFFQMDRGPVSAVFLVGMLIMITLQVSNVRYPKPTKVKWMFFPSVLLVAALFVPGDVVAPKASFVLIFLGVAYVVLGPLYVKIHKAKLSKAASAGAPPCEDEDAAPSAKT